MSRPPYVKWHIYTVPFTFAAPTFHILHPRIRQPRRVAAQVWCAVRESSTPHATQVVATWGRRVEWAAAAAMPHKCAKGAGKSGSRMWCGRAASESSQLTSACRCARFVEGYHTDTRMRNGLYDNAKRTHLWRLLSCRAAPPLSQSPPLQQPILQHAWACTSSTAQPTATVTVQYSTPVAKPTAQSFTEPAAKPDALNQLVNHLPTGQRTVLSATATFGLR
jgi:hypothetical protein